MPSCTQFNVQAQEEHSEEKRRGLAKALRNLDAEQGKERK
jgi:hypothetical protein